MMHMRSSGQEVFSFGPESRLTGPTTGVAARVLERLRGSGWVKGERSDGAHRTCLVGAYAQELYGRPDAAISLSRLSILQQVIADQYPDRFRVGDPLIVSRFNDDDRTTWLDVERVLEKAAQEEGGS